MSPSYEFSYAVTELMEQLSGLFSGTSTLLNLASYVLTALALYTLAQRRGISKPWLSWIPVVNVWILGSLSDQYRYVVKGENKSKRKILLTLNILSAVLAFVICIVAIVMVVDLIGSTMYGAVSEEQLMEAVLGPVVGVMGLALPLAGISIAHAVIYFMALYDVYRSMDPGNSVLFLVLSIIVNVTEPFFLFFNRNKDQGMPPRKQEPVFTQPQEPQWQPQQPVQEPWENPENKDYL